VSGPLSRRVGAALTWKAVHLGADRVISLVRFLILARLLAPADFGLLAIATVSLELLMTITNFGMIPALIQREEREPRHYHAAFTVGLLRGAAIAAVVVLAAPLIAALFGDDRATNLIRFIALRPLLTAFISIRVADLERELDFRRLALTELPSGIVQTVVAIALVPMMGVYAIVAGMLTGAVLHVAMSYRMAPYRPRLMLARDATADLFRYGRWILATSLVSVLGESALRVIISRQLGTAELGLYYLATRLVSIPNGVISAIVGSVSFPLHARLQEHAGRAVAAFQANLSALLATLVPIYIGVIALAPALVRDVLDERWDGAVPAIRMLALAPLLGIVADSVFPLFEGRGRPERVTKLIVMRSLILLALAWPLATTWGLVGAAGAVVLAEIPTQLVGARMAGRELPKPFSGTGRAVLASFTASGLAGAAAIGVDALVGPPAGLFAGAGAGLLVGVVLLGVLDRLFGVGLFIRLVAVFPPLARMPGLRRLVRHDLHGEPEPGPQERPPTDDPPDTDEGSEDEQGPPS
jgi:lipopolysaccharide exporter